MKEGSGQQLAACDSRVILTGALPQSRYCPGAEPLDLRAIALRPLRQGRTLSLAALEIPGDFDRFADVGASGYLVRLRRIKPALDAVNRNAEPI